MNFLLSIAIGLGLSAACGFKVFAPLLVMSLASLTGNLELVEGFEWIGSYGAFATFGVASIFEVFSYYLPKINRFLESVEGAFSIIAGTVIMASFVVELSPLLQWSLAIIAGGGTSAIIEFSSMGRLKGLNGEVEKNHSLSLASLSLLGAVFFSLLALYAPYLSLFFSLLLIFKALKNYINSFISIDLA